MKFLSTLLLISTSLSSNNNIIHAKEQNCGPSRSTYLGCYENRNQDRALPYEMKEREYTPKECEMACASRGYLYFAREWMGQVRVLRERRLCYGVLQCAYAYALFCLSCISPLFTHISCPRYSILLYTIVLLFQLKRLR